MATLPAFRSLRIRLLGPMVAAALLAAGVVALASYRLGTRWAMMELDSRFHAIRETLSIASFPLNQMVLDSLATLTQTELVARNESGDVLYGTVSVSGSQLKKSTETIDVGGRGYVAFSFDMTAPSARADTVDSVVVLFEQERLNASRRRAALLPLVTGLSTITALTSITLFLTSRLVRRLGILQGRVEAVAAGDFKSLVSDDVNDEVGRLGSEVDAMAKQLAQLWETVNQQQSDRLLHQVAGGMAHQLRNTLTGARMAVELHASECDHGDEEGVRVAINQIELAEDYVRRLLLAASGRQDKDRPMTAAECLRDLRTTLSPIAKHLRVELDWITEGILEECVLRDGPTWIAAVSNLVTNAMQAGNRVCVKSTVKGDASFQVVVSDNGPGVDDSVAGDLFDPFVTSKPEGMGLGLSVVRRAAEYHDGTAQWRRFGDRTEFEMRVKTLST